MFTSTNAKKYFGKKLKLTELLEKNNEKMRFLFKVTPFNGTQRVPGLAQFYSCISPNDNNRTFERIDVA